MKILVAGSSGQQGRRYSAILKYLGHDVVPYDIVGNQPMLSLFDKAIIATPTDTHYLLCKILAKGGKDFLCEKPVSKNPDEVREIMKLCKENNVDGRMISNWRYVTDRPLTAGQHTIEYSNWNTGKDGLAWDCIQLIYLDRQFPTLSNKSPYFKCQITSTSFNNISLGLIDNSYLTMIVDWLNQNIYLWTMEDALAATLKVKEYIKHVENI